MNKVHFSSKTDDWATPQNFYDKLNAEFYFKMDLCASAENTKAPHFISKEVDSLLCVWHAFEGPLWLNPPYGREIKHWVSKARRTADLGVTVVCLLPARTDTSWWHDHVIGANAEVRFVRGRLKFGDAKNSAPFPSAVVIFWGKNGT